MDQQWDQLGRPTLSSTSTSSSTSTHLTNKKIIDTKPLEFGSRGGRRREIFFVCVDLRHTKQESDLEGKGDFPECRSLSLSCRSVDEARTQDGLAEMTTKPLDQFSPGFINNNLKVHKRFSQRARIEPVASRKTSSAEPLCQNY